MPTWLFIAISLILFIWTALAISFANAMLKEDAQRLLKGVPKSVLTDFGAIFYVAWAICFVIWICYTGHLLLNL